jgi:hypothetical protein
MARKRSLKGVTCKRTHFRGGYRQVCRSKRTGRIVRSGPQSRGRKAPARRTRSGGKKNCCPKKFHGHKVYRTKEGACYARHSVTGQTQFVAKKKRC